MANTLLLNPSGQSNSREVAATVNLLVKGKTNNVISVTLTANSTTSVVNHPNIGSNSAILFSPTTANASAAIATTYVSSISEGTMTLTHTNNAQTNRTFRVAIIG